MEIEINKKYLVRDKIQDEYGLLHFEKLKNVLSKFNKTFHEESKNFTPDHVFYNPNRPDKLPDISSLIEGLGELANKPTGVVDFFDENKKQYDRATCMTEQHYDRYDIIKELKDLNEFFEFKKRKGN